MTKYDHINITDGLDEVLVQIGTQVPIFAPMLLTFVFLTVAIGGMIAQKTRTGFADAPLWFTIGSLSAFLVALPLTLTAGIVSVTTYGVLLVIGLISAMWLILVPSNREV